MRWVAPFGNPRINGCSPLPAAYRSVLRPSSPLNAKASPECPFALDSLSLSLTLKMPPKESILRASRKNPNYLPLTENNRFFSLSSSHSQHNPSPLQKDLEQNPLSPVSSLFRWRWSGSNRRPQTCGACALPPELHPHPYTATLEVDGIEPTTSDLQSLRSTN